MFGGLSVRTVVPNPSTRPGLSLPGRVLLAAGSAAVVVEHVVLGLVTRVEPAAGDDPPTLVEFHRTTVTGRFVLAAGESRALPFAHPLPWETPITVLGGQGLLDLRMGLRTEVAVGPLLDQGDLLGLFVHPLPAQERLLGAFDTLGFELRQVGMQAGRLPGVAHDLPFHQKIGFWVGPLYAGPMSELEVTFLADPTGLEVIFWVDRRLALAGFGHFSISRFRVRHDGVDEVDWTDLLDSWLRHAIERHAAAAAGPPAS
ncbi:sporulation protein [Solwaraspora sp. WMMD1047]|uniref:sporulation protein n=1 Tax=Solwaraspora sp. WMMD1047 TaxID=3016102 RepID=UPI0024160F21|nr:sporulation protein [Solwaraspora sp. WMMD1047]MDG4829717.1 sporulation protein [Solwaraspora sp. WMMD1047]